MRQIYLTLRLTLRITNVMKLGQTTFKHLNSLGQYQNITKEYKGCY